MGCSSAKTFRTVGGQPEACAAMRRQAGAWGAGEAYEAFGMPMDVLIGGGPAMVGALWDVLAGDLETLVCGLLERWMAPVPAAADVGSCGCDASAVAKAPGAGQSLMGALKAARLDCRLRFLTGAAVVCYGIPM